jgi:CHRD domain
MTKRRAYPMLATALALGLVGASIAFAAGADNGRGQDENAGRLHASLIGYQEVPALNTPGHAAFTATMTSDTITFQLDYADLTGPPGAAHIHVGQRGVSGGVSAFFCGGGTKPPCPATPSGTVSGTITAADVIGPAGQGFNAGDLAALERAIKAGVSYANMHTAKFPGGEIRGQIGFGGGGQDH